MRYTEAAFEHTSKGPCFIAAKDKATAHRRTVFEISADHSRAGGAGMPPPPKKSQGMGEGVWGSVDIFSFYHQWLKCSWGRLLIHTGKTNLLVFLFTVRLFMYSEPFYTKPFFLLNKCCAAVLFMLQPQFSVEYQCVHCRQLIRVIISHAQCFLF